MLLKLVFVFFFIDTRIKIFTFRIEPFYFINEYLRQRGLVERYELRATNATHIVERMCINVL